MGEKLLVVFLAEPNCGMVFNSAHVLVLVVDQRVAQVLVHACWVVKIVGGAAAAAAVQLATASSLLRVELGVKCVNAHFDQLLRNMRELNLPVLAPS